MRKTVTCANIMFIGLFIATLPRGQLRAEEPIVVNFDTLPGAMDIFTLHAIPGETPIPVAARLFDQLLPAPYGLIFTSGGPYVSLIYYDRYGCIDGAQGIQGSTPEGVWSISSLHPVVINFFKPGDTSVPAVTDFVSAQGDHCGDGTPITLEAYDINGSLLQAVSGPDNGAVLTVSTPTKTIHQVKLLGHLSMTEEGVVWDNLTYNPPTYRDFIGFLSPVGNPPVNNIGQAGRTYPIKWQLKNSNGNYISDLGVVLSISWIQTGDAGTIGDPMEATTSGSSGLHYDGTANQYIYNWKTSKEFAGLSYRLDVKLNDGTVHSAMFSFTK